MEKGQKVTRTAYILLTIFGVGSILLTIALGFFLASESDFQSKILDLQSQSLSEVKDSFEHLREGDKDFCLDHSGNSDTYDACYSTSGLSSYGVIFVKDGVVVHSQVFGT